MGQTRPLLFYFRPLLRTMAKFDQKSVDGMLGDSNQGLQTAGADESTVLWRLLHRDLISSDLLFLA